ncbi:MAG: endolytic transglycosylase MltG [Pseudanabaenaceae cyanobacterium]
MTKTTQKNRGKLILPLIVLGVGWGSIIWWLWASSPPGAGMPQKVRVVIADGMSSAGIAQQLEAAGVIRSGLALRLFLQWQALQQGGRIPLRAGTYELATDLPLPEVVKELQSDRARLQVMRVTIPEGWNLRDMAQLFEAKGLFSAQAFLQIANRPPAGRRAWLPADSPNLEGFLFPDTYEVIVGVTTPEEVVEMMLDRFEAVALPVYFEYRQRVTAPAVQLSLKEWVALASIVEKETVLERERRLIAGVFWHRLQKNMRLESDPTVEYGLGIRQTKEQPLTLAQVRTPHPYNTYLNAGIPPGAIAAPGLASLKAVLNPEPTEYLFFVARYDGSHAFSRTHGEHLKQVELIARKIREKQ